MRREDLEREGLSVEEAGRVGGFGRTKGFQLIREGKLPARKNGHQTVILKSELMIYLNSLPFAAASRGK